MRWLNCRRAISEWETMVPPEVKQIIKERQFFGYQPPKAA